MTKNQRIANELSQFSIHLKELAYDIDTIRGILQESEQVKATLSNSSNDLCTSATVNEANKKIVNMALRQKELNELNELAKEIFTQPIGNKSNPYTVNKTPIKTVPVVSSMKSTSEVVPQQPYVEENTPNGLGLYKVIYGPTTNLKMIRSTKTTILYKITQGKDCGAVLTVNKKTCKVIKDGRYVGVTVGQLAHVSKDRDGIDYVNRMIRPQLKALGRSGDIIRYYRPNYHFRKADVGFVHQWTITDCVIYPKTTIMDKFHQVANKAKVSY